MRPTRSDGFSDLERARQTVRRLAQADPAPAAPGQGQPAPAPLRFSRARLGGAAEPERAEPAAGADRWSDALESCRALASAQAALLLDEGGLVVASAGRWPRPSVESECARLVGAMDQLSKLAGGQGGGLAVEVGDGWITGIPVALEGGARLTLALLAPAPLPAPVRSFVHAETRRLAQLARP